MDGNVRDYPANKSNNAKSAVLLKMLPAMLPAILLISHIAGIIAHNIVGNIGASTILLAILLKNIASNIDQGPMHHNARCTRMPKSMQNVKITLY